MRKQHFNILLMQSVQTYQEVKFESLTHGSLEKIQEATFQNITTVMDTFQKYHSQVSKSHSWKIFKHTRT